MASIVVSAYARDDLERIWLYIATENMAAADKLLQAIDQRIRQLERFPESGPCLNEVRPGCHMLTYGTYTILYEYYSKENLVEIVAIVESMRNREQ